MSFPPPTQKQARILWASLTALAVGVFVALLVVLLWVLGLIVQQLSSVLLPLSIAAIIACLLDPLVDRLEGRGLPRVRAIICVFALGTVIFGALIGSVLPQIINETKELAERIPAYAVRVQQRAENWINNPPARLRKWLSLPTAPAEPGPVNSTEQPPDTVLTNQPPPTPATGDGGTLLSKALEPKTIRSATTWLAGTLPKVGSWLFGQVTRVASWLGVLAGLLLIPVYAFYLLLEKRGIQSNWTDYLPLANSNLKDQIVFVVGSINDCLIAFFRGQVLVAVCDGVLYTIGFFSIGLPFAFLLGAMAIVLTMIPFLGAMVTCIAALIIAFAQFGDWRHPALVLGVFAVVQTLEALVVSPKIMGNRVGLHPLTIIIAVMAGTTLMGGILGGILAIPLTAALRALMFRYVWKVRGADRTAETERLTREDQL
jgi:predicted PurR-regulated permease PerM